MSRQSAECYSREGSKFQGDTGCKFLQQLSPVYGSTALDLGCGTGYLAVKLSDCVGPEGKVIAVDPDGERLKIAQKKHARDNVKYVNRSDATFPEGPYDLVFSNQVIHWLADKDVLLRRVYESLKSGGRFAFTTLNGDPMWPPVARNCMAELFGPGYFEYIHHERMFFLTCDQYQELAESRGFVVASMEDKDVPGLRTEGADDIIVFFFALMQGELDRDSISEETIKNCREKYDDDLYREAELNLKFRLLHVVLTKP